MFSLNVIIDIFSVFLGWFLFVLFGDFCLFFIIFGNLSFEKDNCNTVTFPKLKNFLCLEFPFYYRMEKG